MSAPRYQSVDATNISILNTNFSGNRNEQSATPQNATFAPSNAVVPVTNGIKIEVGCEGGPTAWDSSLGQHPSMRYLDVTGLRVKYRGPGSDDRDAASIRSNNAIPKGCPVYYFEVDIVNKGRDGYIGIGLSVKDVKLDRLPGWEPKSYGYHGDDGHVFNGRGTGRPYGPMYTTGDWIGVIYNKLDRTITFTKKGFQLGAAFTNVPDGMYYPTVGFRTPEEEITVNFGDDLERRPFKGDYEAILESVVSSLYNQALQTKVPSDMNQSDVVAELVFDYLQHHGYWDTAQVVVEDVLKGKANVSESMKEESTALYSVTEYILAGDSSKAIAAAESLCPGIMERNGSIAFALKCQVLSELIQAKQDEEAMRYGREELLKSCKTTEDTELLDKTLSLFAYNDPKASPYGYLLEGSHKMELAAALARALRKYLGKREVSTLEDMYRHACVLVELLKHLDHPAARLIQVKNFVDESS